MLVCSLRKTFLVLTRWIQGWGSSAIRSSCHHVHETDITPVTWGKKAQGIIYGFDRESKPDFYYSYIFKTNLRVTENASYAQTVICCCVDKTVMLWW